MEALCQKGQLVISIPGRPGEVGLVHFLTPDDMRQLQASISDALAQREIFDNTPWAGPTCSGRRSY